METNFFKYKAICEKKYREGVSDAEARLRAKEADKEYFGDELVAKIRKHDGTYIFQMKECVFEEMLKYITLLTEVAETVFYWNCITGVPDHISKAEQHLVYFINGLKPNEVYMESMKKCYKGSAMMDFYRDPEAKAKNEKIEKMKLEVTEKWHY